MINLFLTRRQLFILVVGTPLATILLFVLGVYSGAAIGAPGPLAAEPDQSASQDASQPLEAEHVTPSILDAAMPLSIEDSEAVTEPAIRPFSRARHSVRIERESRETPQEATLASKHAPAGDNPAHDRLYSIQAGVFAELANARKLDRTLKAQGLSSRLEVVDGPEGASKHYRVRIGLFATRTAAMATLEAHDRDALPGAFIVTRPLNRS
ncbi:SPOR domain-containing protein [Thioalkalivibrio sp. ALMg11]|uniref:SPOR domain-containing protein n=1 Tax=Thioalkalivibrio sp. ALMg11 TaxID=1158165 RepID=UPI000373DB1C|nr:SPOR domain-containing protein [Thioalkalivibrio sp. ALMg11]